MFFPYGDDNPSSRFPAVNYAIIGLNVAVFLVANVFSSRQFGNLPGPISREYGFVPGEAHWYMFFTSMFLHGSLLHIIGNMVFLWIAGDNVEDKLGRVFYLVFYLASGVLACVFYMLITGGAADRVPLVGASGAIAGVLGAYMVLFPRVKIRIFYWLYFFIGTFEIEARWFLAFWIGENLFNWLVLSSSYVTGVAYAAHVGGFAAGVLVAVTMKEHLRKKAPASRHDRYTGFAKTKKPPPRRPVFDPGPASRPGQIHPRMKIQRDGEGFFGLEEAIAENVQAGRVDVALDRYEEYLSMRHAKPLPPWAQIEIAAEFFRRGDYEEALKAYRRYVAHFPAGADCAEAKFRLGMILSRHRNEYFRAREYLLQASIEHPDPAIVDFARKELERIAPHLEN